MSLNYLDHNATTEPLPQVIDAMTNALKNSWANPSSIHRPGQQVRQQMELARQQVAQLIGAPSKQIIFTSGGTEANNLAIIGMLRPYTATPRNPIVISPPTEHSAVSATAHAAQQLGITYYPAEVDTEGRIDLNILSKQLTKLATNEALVLVSACWANNETGVISPIETLIQTIQDIRQANPDARILLHTDATQAVGKLPINVLETPVDLMTFSAHKFHGPKGAGVLYLKRNVRVSRLNHGGPQETGRRGGTENVPAILGAGIAAEQAQRFLEDTDWINRQQQLRDQFEQRVLEQIPGSQVNGANAPRLWNTTNIAFPGLEAEAILLGLSEKGICASAGAACSSGSLEPSPILLAMGLPEPVAHGSVRFSISRFTTQESLNQAVDALTQVISRLGRVMPV